MTRTTKSIKVEVYTISDLLLITFDDADNPGAGTSALAQLSAKEMIHALASGEDHSVDTYIPFHAIDYVNVTITNTTEEVSDAVCAD